MRKLEAKHEKEKDRLLKLSEISLILDTYDDIFSDFDPRPYSVRALSQDFLEELKRGSVDKVSGDIELTLLIPTSQKDRNRELIIEERLRDHFKKHHASLLKKVWRVKKMGGVMVFVGTFLGTSVAIANMLLKPTFTSVFALVFLEPASWFLIWEGLGKIFEGWHSYKPDLEFYKKMSDSKISFLPY